MASTRHTSDELMTVAGGVTLPDHLDPFRDDDDNAPTDDLGQRLYTLMKLHPDVELSFRQDDITAMDDDTKRLLISDFQAVLQIEPLKPAPL